MKKNKILKAHEHWDYMKNIVHTYQVKKKF